ncbi:MAG: response regulator transcription factor, partial [Gemmatimonadales bacterium]
MSSSVQPIRSEVVHQGPRVLIADDDPAARLLVRRVAERRFGAVVREAADGNEALAACRQE